MLSCLFAIHNSELCSMLAYEYPVTVRHVLSDVSRWAEAK